MYGEIGHYCFESRHFSLAIPRLINLETISRQSDNGLIECINNSEKEIPTCNTVQ